ncbi:MAG TPA: 30S ribosomal protein S1 [Thermodesulfovibrionales bacterium]|nr:30S ribosomal protein S1 [Thermodesulfovibrionales bacterium]
MSEEKIVADSERPDEHVEAGGVEESFAELLEKSGSPSGRLEPGQKVRAKVISISEDFVYIDLGGKSEGMIDVKEFMDQDGTLRVREGEEIEAFFVSLQDGGRVLTTKIRGYAPQSLKAIRDAFEAGLPVTGEVKREVKGGFEISVGGVRCFCPFSQIDLRGGREGGIFLGQSFSFKVLEFGEEGRNIVVSRRVLLEEEKRAKREKLKETLEVGMEVTGRVRSLQNFGAFLDIGGIDGLLPVSEIAWGRTERPQDVLSVGQEVKVKIISLDWESNRLTLSMRQMQQDPWMTSAERYPVDSRVQGTIVRLTAFGAFVNLEPGIDGLIHISNLGAGRRINHPKEVVEVGQVVEAYVLEVDPLKRKLSLSMQPKPKVEKIALPAVGEVLEGVVEKVMPFGIFLRLNSGLTGLIPNAEVGTPRGTDHSRMFPEGTPMQAVVADVDSSNGKVRLSRKGVLEKKEQEEFNRYKDAAKEKKESSGGLGILGEALKAKLEEKNK